MTLIQKIVTIGLCSVATILSRALPFIIFNEKHKTPKIILYIGRVLPLPLFILLLVYSLKETNILGGQHGIPELIGVGVTIVLHLWRRSMLLSMAGGVIVYMILVQVVFI